MTEMDQSGSEGGVALTPPSLPLSFEMGRGIHPAGTWEGPSRWNKGGALESPGFLRTEVRVPCMGSRQILPDRLTGHEPGRARRPCRAGPSAGPVQIKRRLTGDGSPYRPRAFAWFMRRPRACGRGPAAGRWGAASPRCRPPVPPGFNAKKSFSACPGGARIRA